MNATIHSASLLGLEAIPVKVHAELAADLTIQGVESHQARETRVRVLASFAHVGLTGGAKITIEGHPGGSIAHLDLAIAAAVLEVNGHWVVGSSAVILGELDFSGRVRPIRGISVLARDAFAIVPLANSAEASQVTREAFSVATLTDLPHGKEKVRLAERELSRPARVRGMVLVGPPGSGATLIARQMRDAMPFERSPELDRIYSVAGIIPDAGYVTEVPFRAPHYTVSEAGLVGGGSPPRPGEVSLAHRGVLYLDEIHEFRAAALDALFCALKLGVAQSGRGLDQTWVKFPARPALVIGSGPDTPRVHALCDKYGLEPIPLEKGAVLRAAIARCGSDRIAKEEARKK